MAGAGAADRRATGRPRVSRRARRWADAGAGRVRAVAQPARQGRARDRGCSRSCCCRCWSRPRSPASSPARKKPAARAAGSVNAPAGGGAVARGEYAAPLQLAPGRTAMRSARPSTAGPGDPTQRRLRVDPRPGPVLPPVAPRHLRRALGARQQPRQRRELHVRGRERADRLPYMTALRVAQRRAQRAALQARHRLRAGARADDRERAALPAGRVVAGSAGARRHQERRARCSSRPRPAARGDARRAPATAEPPAGEAVGRAARAADGAGEHPAAADAGDADERSCRAGSPPRAKKRRRPSRRWSPPATGCTTRAYLYGGAHGTSLDTLQPRL